MAGAKERSALEQLPNEIKSAIFAALPDVKSLRCVILAGRELYSAFKSDEFLITREVLGNQIQQCVLRDAVTVWGAKRADHKGWNHQQIARLFHGCSYQTDSFFKTCDLPRASEIVRFYETLQGLSKCFADQALRSFYEKYGDGVAFQAASQEELVRIERAFYRFELYCVLFGNSMERLIEPGRRQREALWDRFAPWEIEQIACVYEYLRAEVTTSFQELVLKVPAWTEFTSITGALTEARDEFLQAQMTRGLKYVVRIIANGNVGTRDLDLRPPRSKDDQVFDLYSLEESLNWAIDLGDPNEYLTLQELERDPEKASKIIKPSFCVDLDTGPESAWRWAHRDVIPDFGKRSGFVLGESRTPLRECGYVFWNQERLEELRLLDTSWQHPDEFEILDERERRVREFEQSLHFRMEDFIHRGILRRGLWT